MIASQCPKKICAVNMPSMIDSQKALRIRIVSTSDQKPSIILFYKKTKGGIDTSNGMVRSYSTKRMTRRCPLVLLYNKINASAINAFIIWQEIDRGNGNICMRQKRKFLISLGKELCGITEEAHPVAPISANRNGTATFAGNGVSLNKRARCALCDGKKDQTCRFIFF